MKLTRLVLSAVLVATPAPALFGQTPDDAWLDAVETLAALPGSPSVVSAAGITRADERILTIEHDGDEADSARRLVIIGGLDGAAESVEAVLAALRWFKTDAPDDLKRRWSISVLPCAYPRQCSTASAAAGRGPGGRATGGERAFPPEDGFYNHETSPEPRYIWRWVAFQAPDLLLEVRSSGSGISWEISAGTGSLGLQGPRPPSGTLAAAMSAGAPSGLAPVPAVRATTSIDDAPRMLRTVLEAASALGRSPLHEVLVARARRTPIEIATVLANRYPASPSISYIPAVAWANTIRLASRLGDSELLEKVRDQMSPFLSGETPAVTEPYRLTNLAGHFALADFSGPGRSPAALDLAIAGAEFMFPESPDEILRSPTGWTDDMFMASSLLSRIGSRTGDPRYGATVGRLLTSYTESLRRADGLFVHSREGPQAWGRGNGFAILGLTEALTYLPDDWADRPRILEIYRRHAATLVRHQSPDGMWHQIVDEKGSYRELTVTSMVLVAMARGVRLGWLDDSYRAVIERAWDGVARHITEQGEVVDASTSTGAGETKQYYLDRAAIFGPDERGGAMALWAATEMDDFRRQRSP